MKIFSSGKDSLIIMNKSFFCWTEVVFCLMVTMSSTKDSKKELISPVYWYTNLLYARIYHHTVKSIWQRKYVNVPNFSVTFAMRLYKVRTILRKANKYVKMTWNSSTQDTFYHLQYGPFIMACYGKTWRLA